jgi:hypothetical protein
MRDRYAGEEFIFLLYGKIKATPVIRADDCLKERVSFGNGFMDISPHPKRDGSRCCDDLQWNKGTDIADELFPFPFQFPCPEPIILIVLFYFGEDPILFGTH